MEPEVSLVESGEQDIVEVNGPDAIVDLFHAYSFLEQGIAQEELAVLEAEGTGVAHLAGRKCPVPGLGNPLGQGAAKDGTGTPESSSQPSLVRPLLVVLEQKVSNLFCCCSWFRSGGLWSGGIRSCAPALPGSMRCAMPSLIHHTESLERLQRRSREGSPAVGADRRRQPCAEELLKDDAASVCFTERRAVQPSR